MAVRALRCGAVLLWSLSLMPQEGWATSDQEQVSSEVNEDVQDCDEELNKSDPFHSCLCKRWEKTFKKRYPDVDYSACEELYKDKETGDRFLDWYKEYKRNYTDYAEKKKRFAIFAANYVYMQFKNRTTNDYELDVNEFADMTPEEFKTTHLGLGSTQEGPSLGTFSQTSDELPETVDYVESGAVNRPVNQGDAQSCWAFTAAASVEGGWQKRTGVLVELSPQQFLDCTGNGMTAVAGGDLITPINSVAVNNDLCSDASYPYTMKDGTCKQGKASSCTVRIPQGAVTGYMNIKTNDERALMTALYLSGPVSVGIAADGTQLMFYKRGVMTAECGGAPNHAVNVVGYGRDGALPFWKLKNSWGPWWGENGFFRLVRGKDGAGECSVKSMPAIPVFTDDATVLGMAGKLGNEPTKVVVGEGAALELEDAGSETTWDDRWDKFKSDWLSGVVSWTWAAVIGLSCCFFGCCMGTCCGGGKGRSSRGAALMEDDEDEENYYSSDDE